LIYEPNAQSRGQLRPPGRGFELLRKELPGFYAPTAADKKRILEILGISQRFKATFDAIRLKVPTFTNVQNPRDFDLLELKVTDKYLPNLPQGFFFGMTENEEMLLKVFEGKYLLCLVCMNSKSKGYALVDWSQLKQLTHALLTGRFARLKADASTALRAEALAYPAIS
jgi:hypothetical protein